MPDGSLVTAFREQSQQELRGWIMEGRKLGERERSARSLMWAIGDWWNRGEPYRERADIVNGPDWTGPTHGTCRYAGSVAKRWPVLCRHNALTFEHHRFVAPLPDAEASTLLQWCLDVPPREDGRTPEPRSTQELRARVKQVGRERREAEFATRTGRQAAEVGHQLFGVIYCDPPWQFEPYSRDSGMDRAADNHYPTMTQDELAALDLPAADDCVLFCWATVAMLPAGMAFLSDHGFTYRTAYFWLKPGPGHGYWSAVDQIEILLLGTRGTVPAPAPGTQPPQTITAPRARHSEKPAAFAHMIEVMFPNVPRLEMFARCERPGWQTWGYEAP
jgi:N6-adenosine-specific RNA methylase IME4